MPTRWNNSSHQQALINRQLCRINQYLQQKKQANLPWYLCIGEAHCGRSSLLKLLYPKTFKRFPLGSDHGVMISTPKAVFIVANEQSLNIKNDQDNFWLDFWLEIKQFRHKKIISGCLITTAASTLYQKDGQIPARLQSNLQIQMNMVLQACKQSTFEWWIMCCDHIPGFNEFSTYLDPHQQRQSLGFDIKHKDSDDPLHNIMDAFDQFIQRLGTRAILLSKQCQNKDKTLIEQFPLQAQYLKMVLDGFLNDLPTDQLKKISGIYWTSIKDQHAAHNWINPSVIGAKHNKAKRSKGLFIDERLRYLGQKRTPWFYRIHPRSLGAPIALVIGLIAAGHAWHHHAHHVLHVSPKKINTSSSAAMVPLNLGIQTTSSNIPNNSDLKTIILQAYALFNKAYNQAPWYAFWSHWTKLTPAQQTITQQQFKQMLKQQIAPLVQSLLQTDINNKNLSAIQRWEAYQVLAMLVLPQHGDKTTVARWINENSSINDSQTKQALMALLNHQLKQADVIFSLNATQKKENQQVMQHLNFAQVVYQNMQRHWNKKKYPFTLHSQTIYLPQTKLAEAMFYPQVKHVLHHQIPNASQALQQYSWATSLIGIVLPKEALLQQATQETYALDYQKTWQRIANQIHLKAGLSSSIISQFWSNLAAPNSDTWRVIQTIQNNVKRQPQEPAFNAIVYQQFTALLQSHAQKITLAIQPWLKDRNNILQDKAPSLAAYNFSSALISSDTEEKTSLDQLLRSAKKWAQPLNNLVQDGLTSDWRYLLQQSKFYINSIWTNDIYKEFSASLSDRFPLANSKKDITLKDFNHFFSPNGSMDNFFNFYIRPFVDTSQPYWHFKHHLGYGLPMTQHSLNIFVRSALIQKMFYPNQSAKPKVNFNLTPLSLSANTTQFSLNMNGQMIQVMPGDDSTFSLQWPGPGPTMTTMRFTNPTESNPSNTITGAWSWFRLLKRSQLKSTNNAKNYQVTFSIGDDTASFTLRASEVVNPFIPGVLNNFSAPKKLN